MSFDDDFERMVRETGFSGMTEFNRMVAAVRLDTTEDRVAFKRWQNADGTKRGLQLLPRAARPTPEEKR